MTAAIAPAEPIRPAATAPARGRPLPIGADSPELLAGNGSTMCSADSEPSGGEGDARAEEPPQRTAWPPRGPASTALLTIGRPPRAVRV